MKHLRIMAVVALAIAFIAAGCGSIETYQPASGKALSATITIKVTDAGFDPKKVTSQGGVPTTLVVTNEGSKHHAFRIDAFQGTQDIRLEIAPGKSDQVTLTATYPEHYKYFSDLPGDEDAGLVGELLVKTIW